MGIPRISSLKEQLHLALQEQQRLSLLVDDLTKYAQGSDLKL